MTDDRGAAALVERLMAAEAELDWRYDDWSGRDITNAAMRRWCRAILGEHGVFLPDGGCGHEWVEGEGDDGCCGWVCGRHITDHSS